MFSYQIDRILPKSDPKEQGDLNLSKNFKQL